VPIIGEPISWSGASVGRTSDVLQIYNKPGQDLEDVKQLPREKKEIDRLSESISISFIDIDHETIS
jgi:hypothetical protein